MSSKRKSLGKKGVDLIKHFEGLRLKTYKDAVGIPTIGYGTTRIDGKRVPMGLTITKDRAEELLYEDAESFSHSVNSYVKVPITQEMFDSLVSFSYNVGSHNLHKSTLLRKLNDKDYEGASDEFHKWVYAGGKKLNGLVRRRSAERNLFLENIEKLNKKKKVNDNERRSETRETDENCEDG